MDAKDKLFKIQSIKNETEIHELLAELLPKMGYSDVTVTHERGNVPELGKDVVASRIDDVDDKKEWTAFVVKKGDIKGTSAGTSEIKAQVSECFTFAWNSITKGKNISMNKVKVVTNGKFNSGAESKILQDQFYENPNISLWDGLRLVSLIDKHYPRYWLKGDKTYNHYVELFQKKNKDDDFTKALGIKNNKIKKIIDFAISPKLIETKVAENGELKRRLFNTHEVGKLETCTLVVGASGAGKSTFFKQLANDIIYENKLRNNYELYPFILQFTHMPACNFDIKRLLQEHLNTEDFSEIQIDLDELFVKGNFVLFIDSLDELAAPDAKEKALCAIQEFHRDYPSVKIYFSSRPADSLLASCQKLQFRYLEILNVSMKQAEQFLGRYFDDEQVKCKRLLKSLRDSRILDKLPKTPITLALIAAIFDENEVEIPATISDLYKYFADLLLNKSFKDSTLDLLKVGVHRSTLSYLALHLHNTHVNVITKDDAIKIISEFASQRGHTYDVEQLVDELINNIGLLILTDRNEVEFKHLSFQEYFTAYQIYNHEPNKKSLFIEGFNDLWWQNVAIFYAGMTKDSPELLTEILAAARPKTFQEYAINISGLGYLMQALYNTPISIRIEGLERNLENASKAVDFILNTTHPEYNLVKSFFNTKYGAYKIISMWYEFHHTSITLKDPLEQLFATMIALLKDSTGVLSSSRSEYEYSAYLLASTLSEVNDEKVKYLQELITVVDPKNFYVVGLIDSNFSQHAKNFDKTEKVRNDVKKLRKRLDLIDREKMVQNVNISLTDNKLVDSRKRRS